MATIILIVVFGIFFAYFATLNTVLVSIQLGQTLLPNLPLYVVILVSIAIGVVISAIVHFVHVLTSSFNMSGKERNLVNANKQIAELTKEAHQLELENADLKSKLDEEDFDDDSI